MLNILRVHYPVAAFFSIQAVLLFLTYRVYTHTCSMHTHDGTTCRSVLVGRGNYSFSCYPTSRQLLSLPSGFVINIPSFTSLLVPLLSFPLS